MGGVRSGRFGNGIVSYENLQWYKIDTALLIDSEVAREPDLILALPMLTFRVSHWMERMLASTTRDPFLDGVP